MTDQPQILSEPTSKDAPSAHGTAARVKPLSASRDVGLEHQKYLDSIAWVSTGSIKGSAHNTRRHSKKQIKRLCEGYKKFGVMTPILVDGAGEIIAGHGRHEAAQALGLEQVPVVVIRHLTEGAKRAYRIADNKIHDESDFDEKALALEMRALIQIDPEFDARDTGFDTVDIDLLIQSVDNIPHVDLGDETPEPSADFITQRGDLWLLGNHRLLCGDATSLDDCRVLVGESQIRQVITDPPYGCVVNGHVSGLGKVKHREFVMGSGEMTREELKAFFHKAFSNIAAVTQAGALVYSFIDFRGLRDMLDAGEAVFTELKGVLTWVKRNAGMGALYRSQTEFITLWKHGAAPHRNNINLGVRRYRTTAWTYDGVNSLRPGREEELAGHPTPKPVQMVADAMLDCSNRGDAILDLFAGGGTIFIAAERTGRRAYGMELDPIYCDVIIRRWQKFTGRRAVLESTGETFDQVAEVRHV